MGLWRPEGREVLEVLGPPAVLLRHEVPAGLGFLLNLSRPSDLGDLQDQCRRGFREAL